MPQVRKPEVDARIRAAALEEFAARGFTGATMAAVAARSGTAPANLYRYHSGKQALFDAVITPEFVGAFTDVLDRRVEALAPLAYGAAQPAWEREGPQEDLLNFWVAHRLQVIIVLDRADGTAYASFGEEFVGRPVERTTQMLSRAHPSAPMDDTTRVLLTNIFDAARRSIVNIVATFDDAASIRRALEGFWSFQLTGLRAFAAWLAGAATPDAPVDAASGDADGASAFPQLGGHGTR